MSGAGGKRRSLLANAIDSIGAAQAPAAGAESGAGGSAVASERYVGEPSPTSFLERRGLAFDEIARTVKRPTIRLKPAECSIWPGNARDYAALTHERCQSLIDSIREEGTNREPVVIRRTPNADRPYELIVGSRRHFSVSWLQANNHTDIELVARIETLDDEGAFRLADLENREREDVTDLERARNYLQAVDAYYHGVRTKMAERLAISKQNLHNLLQLAELPEEVVSAFAEAADLKVRHGMRLSPILKDPRHRDAVIAEAKLIANEQQDLHSAGLPRIEGSRVCERLAAVSAQTKAKPTAKSKPALTVAGGREIGQILADTKAKGITININPKGTTSVDEILDALRAVVENAKFMR